MLSGSIIKILLTKFIQAEIDASAELIDFVRFNSYFGKEVMKYQPISENPEVTLNLV